MRQFQNFSKVPPPKWTYTAESSTPTLLVTCISIKTEANYYSQENISYLAYLLCSNHLNCNLLKYTLHFHFNHNPTSACKIKLKYEHAIKIIWKMPCLYHDPYEDTQKSVKYKQENMNGC